MARTDNLNNFLTDVASAIKEKKGDTTPISASNFDIEITNLPSGGDGSSKYAPRFINFYNYKGEELNEEIANLSTKNLTSMQNMFNGCTLLLNLDLSNFDTSNVMNMSSTFNNCGSLKTLDLSNFDTSKVTYMQSTFAYCDDLKSLDLSNFDTSNVTSMSSMFDRCTGLITLNLSSFDTSNVTTMQAMFHSCNAIVNIDISNFDMSKVANVSTMFFSNSTQKLENLSFGYNLGKGYTQKTANYSNYTLDLSKRTLLTHDSLISVINGLYDLNLTYGSTLYTQKLTLGSTNLAKLTAEEIAIATAKGWTVA